MVDIIERLESCLNSTALSATESETEKAIRSAVLIIKELRFALDCVDDMGSFNNLGGTGVSVHC